MKIIIVDDEHLALSRVERLLREIGYENIDSFTDPLEALQSIAHTDYDVAFLDIEMPGMSGLELANKILESTPNTNIVFQTAYSEHAIEAYETGVIDYLLKPTSKERVEKAIQKIEKQKKSHSVEISGKKIIAKSGSRLYPISIDDIFYLQADLDEVIIRAKDIQAAYVRRKISDFEKVLEGKNFFRIHRSCIVNVDKIKSLESIEQSKIRVSFVGIDDIVTSSKDGAKEFREYLEKINL